MNKEKIEKLRALTGKILSSAKNCEVKDKLKDDFNKIEKYVAKLTKISKDKAILLKGKYETLNFEHRAIGVSALAFVLAFGLTFAPHPSINKDSLVAKNMEKNKVTKSAPDKDQCIISIGGKMVLAVASAQDAQAVFDGLKAYYMGGTLDPNAQVALDQEFKWDIYNPKKEKGQEAWEMTPSEAVLYILKGKGDTKPYTVVGGDNLWNIAATNGCTVQDLINMNPGLTENNLQIGMTINLAQYTPYFNITTVQDVTASEAIPYETVYQDSNAIYSGQTKVSKPGVDGSKEIVKKVTKVNGIEVASQVLSEKVISQPVAQVALKGTKAMSYNVVASINNAGKGTLGYPVSHVEISSGFGASRGGGRHTGVDFRNPVGTPIGAAESGTVIFSGYTKGGYGNLVKISHGNGLVTYYAHCDKLLVQAGQQVSRGQTVATVGLTGYTTGAHCHFEVRVNGSIVNPMGYL